MHDISTREAGENDSSGLTNNSNLLSPMTSQRSEHRASMTSPIQRQFSENTPSKTGGCASLSTRRSKYLIPPAPMSPTRRMDSLRSLDIRTNNLDSPTGLDQGGADNTSHYSLMFPPIDEDESGENVSCLVLARLEKIPLKDFSSEVRACIDVDKLLKEAIILLDSYDTEIEVIISSMLRGIFAQEGVQDVPKLESAITDANRALFMRVTYCNHTYQRLSKTLKGILISDLEGITTDQSWLCAMCSLATVTRRHVAIARLQTAVNLGRSSEGVHFIILVVTPTKEKNTKSDVELGRTFATLFVDMEFRQSLFGVESADEFKQLIRAQAEAFAVHQRLYRRLSIRVKEVMNHVFHYESSWIICNGIRNDLKNRLPLYTSDYLDGIRGKHTLRKVISSATFLFFACLLPTLAFGVLNHNNTNGKINVQRMILSQTVGGLVFAILGGQPLIVPLTTAPLSLYIKVIYSISANYQLDFYQFFACVGVCNALFLLIYAVLDLSKLMKWSTRSIEETFAFFISMAFLAEASKDLIRVFHNDYFSTSMCSNGSIHSNGTTDDLLHYFIKPEEDNATLFTEFTPNCDGKARSVLFLLLMIGTAWLALCLQNFTNTPYLNSSKREMIADFSLPFAVIVMSFIGSFIFSEIEMDKIKAHVSFSDVKIVLLNPFSLPWWGFLLALLLAFPLSLLFFMDQNIASAMVNSPANKLKKGAAYHWDLFMVAFINGILSIFGLPWLHGSLPHSPLHVKSLADIEERIDSGHRVHQIIVRVRETRLTGIISHIFIGLALCLLPKPLNYIPIAVLDGLFICMAVAGLYGNQLSERILLFLTEQSAYPPSHYLRRVPQRKVHLFTVLQLIQLAGLCALGFAPSPFAKMGFPLFLILQLPIRHYLMPKVVKEGYLDALDKPF